MAAVRAIAPEVLAVAKTQRWAPEEVLRTLVEAEIAARDASNARAGLWAAGFLRHRCSGHVGALGVAVPSLHRPTSAAGWGTLFRQVRRPASGANCVSRVA